MYKDHAKINRKQAFQQKMRSVQVDNLEEKNTNRGLIYEKFFNCSNKGEISTTSDMQMTAL